MIFIIGFVSALYILLKRRIFDFYSIAVLSCLVYFSPSFFGYVWYRVPGRNSRYEDIFLDIDSGVVMAHSLILTLLLVSMIIWDYSHKNIVISKCKERKYTAEVFAIISTVIYAAFLLQDADAALQGDKMEFGRLYSIAAISLPYSLVLCIISKKYIFVVILSLIVSFDLYIGNREAIVFSSVSALVSILWMRGSGRLVRFYRYITAGVIMAFVVLIYKGISAAALNGDWDLALFRLGDMEYYIDTLSKSEPFVTQAILHYAISLNWTFDGSFIKPIFASLIPFGDVFVGDVETASGYINNHLFEDVGYGVASNVWAESYIYGGWSLLITFGVVYSIFPAVLNNFMNKSPYYHHCAFFSVVGSILLLYIHRIGLVSSINLIKRLVIFYFLCSILSLLVNVLAASIRSRTGYGRLPRNYRTG